MNILNPKIEDKNELEFAIFCIEQVPVFGFQAYDKSVRRMFLSAL